MNRLIINIISLLCVVLLTSSIKEPNNKLIYDNAFTQLNQMLQGQKKQDFKLAVFITENAYLDNKLEYVNYCEVINKYVASCKELINNRQLIYNGTDKSKIAVYASAFSIMKDTIPMFDSINGIMLHLPFRYNFIDYDGDADWTNMFVSKLLNTHLGNCHSLPLLYKIIVEEMGEKVWLACAPNHTYIKLYAQKVGWFNTELTSGMFPIDSWLMASGYIHLNAIQNAMYMDTLSQPQSIALCLTDLGKGFQKKYGIDDGTFILQCSDTALKYYPNYSNALLLKLDVLTFLYQKESDKKNNKAILLKHQMTDLCSLIHQLGYREMPKDMYLKWLTSLLEEKEKYQNKKVVIFTPLK